MYGMVNNAIRQYIIQNHGEHRWVGVAETAGIGADEFGSVVHYDDSVTLSIITSACETLELEPANFLHVIGAHWVEYASSSSFSSLFKFGGHTVQEFIGNLDEMHSKIKVSLPDLRPPSFRVKTLENGHILVTYSSERDGLFPFVEGLFQGLSVYFEQPVEVLDFERHGGGSGTWTLMVAPRQAEKHVA